MPFCRNQLRPLPAFRGDLDPRKIGYDVMAVRGFNAGSNGHVDVRHQVHGDISHASLQHRVTAFSARRDELGDDRSSAGFNMCGRHPPQFDTAAASPGLDWASSAGNLDAPAPSLHLRPAADFAEFNSAPAGRGLHLSSALVHMNTATTGLKRSSLRSRDQHQVSTTALGNHFALRGTNMNRPPAGPNPTISTNVANVNPTAAGFRADRSANVV